MLDIEKELRTLNSIEDKTFREFIKEFIGKYSNDQKIIEANKIGDILLALLDRERKIQPGIYERFVDILLGAALIHNIFYDRNDITTLLLLRKTIYEQDIPYDIREMIEGAIQICESQDGKFSALQKLIPNEMSMEKLFSEAVWINNNFVKKES